MGEYEISRKYNKNWANYLERNDNINLAEENFNTNIEMQKKQKCLRGAIVKKEKQVEKDMGINFDDSDDETDMKQIKKIEKKKVDVESEDKPKFKSEEKAVFKKSFKVDEKKSMPQKKAMALSKVVEKEENKIKKKKKAKRELSCSSGSEELVKSEDEGAAMIFKMKKGMK